MILGEKCVFGEVKCLYVVVFRETLPHDPAENIDHFVPGMRKALVEMAVISVQGHDMGKGCGY